MKQSIEARMFAALNATNEAGVGSAHFEMQHTCDEAQGFQFSKPLAADAVSDFIREHLASVRLPSFVTDMVRGGYRIRSAERALAGNGA